MSSDFQWHLAECEARLQREVETLKGGSKPAVSTDPGVGGLVLGRLAHRIAPRITTFPASRRRDKVAGPILSSDIVPAA